MSIIKYKLARFFLKWEITMLRIDAWMAEQRGDNLAVIDWDIAVYKSEKRLQMLDLQWRLANGL